MFKNIVNYIKADWEIRTGALKISIEGFKHSGFAFKNLIDILNTQLSRRQVTPKQMIRTIEINKKNCTLYQKLCRLYINAYTKYNVNVPKSIINNDKKMDEVITQYDNALTLLHNCI